MRFPFNLILKREARCSQPQARGGVSGLNGPWPWDISSSLRHRAHIRTWAKEVANENVDLGLFCSYACSALQACRIPREKPHCLGSGSQPYPINATPTLRPKRGSSIHNKAESDKSGETRDPKQPIFLRSIQLVRIPVWSPENNKTFIKLIYRTTSMWLVWVNLVLSGCRAFT